MSISAMTSEQILGQNVTRRRKSLNLTIGQVATNVGIDVDRMKEIELGKGPTVNPRLLSDLGEALRCNGNDLLFEP